MNPTPSIPFSVELRKQPTTGARYELYIPKSDSKVPAVILLHGFQCKLDYHRGTAAMLARNGIACAIFDMLPLMGLLQKTLHTLRENNVQATLAYVDWLNGRPDIDPSRVVLAGYSAGGAVAMETGAALVGKGKVRGVLLLDAVPWISTLDKGAAGIGLCMPEPRDVLTRAKDGDLVVASLRGEPSSYNAYNMILEQLARGMGNSKSSCDIRIRSARHGDFMCSSEKELGGGVGGTMGTIMQCIGLFSSKRVRESIQELTLAYCQTMLELVPDASEAKVAALQEEGLVDVLQVDDSLPSKRNNIPHFLK